MEPTDFMSPRARGLFSDSPVTAVSDVAMESRNSQLGSGCLLHGGGSLMQGKLLWCRTSPKRRSNKTYSAWLWKAALQKLLRGRECGGTCLPRAHRQEKRPQVSSPPGFPKPSSTVPLMRCLSGCPHSSCHPHLIRGQSRSADRD